MKQGRYAITGVLCSVTVVIALYPYLPSFVYAFTSPSPNTAIATETYFPSTADVSKEMNAQVAPTQTYSTEEYRLMIPKLGVDASILEGETIEILNQQEGVWHEHGSADPTSDGNMVIAGHRFQFLPPNITTFYHLDKLEAGDEITLRWGTEAYQYRVRELFIVKPEQVEIRKPTAGKKELTLYTCTPIGSNALRLVVKAELQPPSLPTIYSSRVQ